MTNDIPSLTIRAQSQTSLPIVSDATLVDDPIALVDDITALVGGQASIVPGTMLAVGVSIPRLLIKVRR